MNVTVRFGAVAVLKRRFRFMRFGFSFGSCGSVRGYWRFQSPSPKSVENNTFWSLRGMAAEPRGGVHNSGVWGLKLATRVLPRVLLGRGPLHGGVHNSGVWFEACERGTFTRFGGGPPEPSGEYTIREFGVWSLRKGYSRACCWGGARHAGEYTIREFGAWSLRTPTRGVGEGPAKRGSTQFGSLGPACENRVLPGEGPPRGGVHNSGVWGLELAKRVLPRVLLGRGTPHGGVHNSGVWFEACEKGNYSHACFGGGPPEPSGEYTIREFGA